MQSNNGDLYFRAGIDIDGFNVGAEAMEKKMQQTTSTIVHDASQMDDAITKIGSAFTKMVGAASAAAFVKQVAQVRSEIQSLEVSFKTLLGDEAKAMQLMNEIREFAAHTPMQMDDLAKGAQTLLAFNYDAEKVMPTLKALGDISMGDSQKFGSLTLAFSQMSSAGKLMGQDLMQMINAGFNPLSVISEQTGKSISQLKDEMSKGAITSEMVAQAFMDATAEGGKFYGMLDKQSQTLGGALSNVQGALTDMFNEIGEHGEGVILSTVQGAQKLIENYKEVAKILGTLVIAFGAAKAAQVVMNVAQKNGTGIGVIDNTVWAVRSKLLQQQVQTDKSVTKSIREIEAAQKAQIKTLREQITEEEHAEIIRKSRIANLGDVLTETQKTRLAQMGLNETSEQYLPIAMSMLDREQKMKMTRGELTNNNQAYIDAMQGVVTANKEEMETLDKRIAQAQELLRASEDEVAAASAKVATLEKEIDNIGDYKDALLKAGRTTEAQEMAEKRVAATVELETAKKELNTAAENRNTAQKNLNSLATKKQTLETKGNTVATNVNTVAKTKLGLAVDKLKLKMTALWAVMKANPIGMVVGIATTLYSIITSIAGRTKKAEVAMDDYNSTIREEKNELKTLIDTLNGVDEGSILYHDTLEKLKRLAEQYKVELYDENGALREQKQIYEELSAAIRETTGEKIRAKYIEKYNKEREDELEEQLEKLIKKGNKARHWETVTDAAGNKSAYHRKSKNIRNIQESEWVTAFEQMVDTAEQMSEMSAEEAQKLYNTTLHNILQYIQRVSGATHDEMFAIEDDIKTIFGDVIEQTNETNGKIAGLGQIGFSDGIKKETDLAKLSIKELENKISDVNNQLEILAWQSKNMPGVPGVLFGQQDDVPTWGPFIDANAQKQYEKEQERRRYQEELDRRNAAQQQHQQSEEEKRRAKKLAEERKKYGEQLAKQERMLTFDIEDARIAGLQEGADKEIAQLKNNFDRAMAEIELEKAEIDKKRKAMGLAPINWDETDPNKKSVEQQGMEQRQNALTEQYQRDMKHAFDSEVSYKKQQYELYFQWVQQMGADVANAHFAELVKNGTSFMGWIDNQIAELEHKQNEGTITDAELQHLFNLRNEKDTQSGKKTSIEQFMEGVERATNNAPSLVEKLEILRQKLEELQEIEGSELEKNNIAVQLAQQIADTQNQIDDVFDEKYRSYQDKKRTLQSEYMADIMKLQSQGRGMEAENLRREMEAAIKDLDTDFLKGVVSVVFKAPTKKNMREAMQTLDQIQNMTVEQFNRNFNMQLTEEELARLKTSIGDVGTEIKNLGRGYTLADAFREIKDGRITGDMEKVARGTEYMQSAFSKFASVVSSLSNALNDLADASTSQALKDTAKTVSKISNVVQTAGSMAGTGASIAGGWGALVGGILGGGIGIITEVLKDDAERQEKIKENAEKGIEYQKNISSQLGSILGAIGNLTDTITGLDYGNYKEALQDLIDEITDYNRQLTEKGEDGKTPWNSFYDYVYGQGNSNYNHMDNWAWGNLRGIMSDEQIQQLLQNSYNNAYVGQGGFAGFINSLGNWALGDGWEDNSFNPDQYNQNVATGVANYLNWLYSEQARKQEDIKKRLEDMLNSGSYDSFEYYKLTMEAYEAQKEQVKLMMLALEMMGKKDTDAYRDLERQLEGLDRKVADSMQNLAESLYGVDMAGIIDNWISIFEEFGDNIDGAFNKIDDGIDSMIANMLKQRLVVEYMLKYFDNIFKDYENEDGDISEDDFAEIARRIGEGKNYFKQRWMAYLDALRAMDIELGDLTDQSTMTGSIQNLTEETGGLIAGRLEAMIINQAETTGVLRQSLIVQVEMRNYLALIATDVTAIRNNMVAMPFNTNLNHGYTQRAITM